MFEVTNFDDIQVSTKTYGVISNFKFNITSLYNFLPITSYVLIQKKRGRKKKQDIDDPNKDIPYGSIITIKCGKQIRGVETKNKSTKNKLNNTRKNKSKCFRNSITIIIVLDKIINFKVYTNGAFQFTGCKTYNHVKECMKYMWKYIKDTKDIYTFSSGNSIEYFIIPYMRNFNFSLDFNIDRNKLYEYIKNKQNSEKYMCVIDESGYTGVSIKSLVKNDIKNMKIKKIQLIDGKWKTYNITYEKYLSKLPEKDRVQKLSVKKYNTFLVFHSGKIIMSGLSREFMRDTYYEFIETIKNGYDFIKEKLLTVEDNVENTEDCWL
jgi:TATA-box binding protein (TBP) (component of TFIID and TFIIIB)